MVTVVIKLGTSSLFDEETRDQRIANTAQIVETVIRLRRQRHRVCLVSSGGIAAGLKRLGRLQRPKHTREVQAIAAIGQSLLMELWNKLFSQFDQPIAQVLLTRADISDRAQYLNAANTLNALLDMGVVPIVNENDTLTSHEARFGDNDTLSAIIAAMVGANYLFLLTDVDCLYSSNPRLDPNSIPIRHVRDIREVNIDSSMEAGTSVGTGGMTTKLIAANLATSAGIMMFICRSNVPGNVEHILSDLEQGIQPEDSKFLYTRFDANGSMKDRVFWLLHGLKASGAIYIDEGAYRAVTNHSRAGLLGVGVVRVEGTFHTSECVNIYVEGRASDKPVGRCLVNYSSVELNRIKGHHSQDIMSILGYADSEYVAFRSNLAFY